MYAIRSYYGCGESAIFDVSVIIFFMEDVSSAQGASPMSGSNVSLNILYDA